MKIFIVVILCALFIDVAYSGMYELFGILLHDGKPVGSAYLRNKKKAMTAAKFEKELKGDLKIQFGSRGSKVYKLCIKSFSEFVHDIINAEFSHVVPDELQYQIPNGDSHISNSFKFGLGVGILVWNVVENEEIEVTEWTLIDSRPGEKEGTAITKIENCEKDKFVGGPIFQSRQFVGIAYDCKDGNLYWQIIINE